MTQTEIMKNSTLTLYSILCDYVESNPSLAYNLIYGSNLDSVEDEIDAVYNRIDELKPIVKKLSK